MNIKVKSIVAAISIAFMSSSFASENLIFDAIKAGDLERLERVYVADRKSFNYIDDSGNYPIYYAIDKQGKTLDFFIKNITDVTLSVTNKDGLSPLNYAIKNNKYNAVVKLLNRGVNPTIRDAHGKTAFHYAAGGDEKIIMIFKEYSKSNPEFASKFKIEDTVEEKEVVRDEGKRGFIESFDDETIDGLKSVVILSMYDKFKKEYESEFYNKVLNKVKAEQDAERLSELNIIYEKNKKDMDAIKSKSFENINDLVGKHKKVVDGLVSEHKKELDSINKKNDDIVREMNSENKSILDKLESERALEVEKLIADHNKKKQEDAEKQKNNITKIRSEYEGSIESLKQKHSEDIAKNLDSSNKKISDIELKNKINVDNITSEGNKKLSDLQAKYDSLLTNYNSKVSEVEKMDKEIELMYNVFSELTSVGKDSLKELIKKQIDKNK